MHKYCNSDYYLSPLQRCLSLLSRTASSLLVSDIELKCKALLLPARCSKWSFALRKGSSEVQYSRPDTLPRGAVGYSVGFSYIYSVNLTDVCEDRVHHGNDNKTGYLKCIKSQIIQNLKTADRLSLTSSCSIDIFYINKMIKNDFIYIGNF